VPNRTTEQVVADLLLATKESGLGGISPTSLLKRANVSHPRLRRLTAALLDAGLLIRAESGKRHAFVITSKGRHYLELHVEYHNMVESFGLEL